MSILKSKFYEGLELVERNADRLYSAALQAFQTGQYLCSFILGFNCWEEIGKAFLILDNWDSDLITEKKWKGDFIRHDKKIEKARYRRDQLLAGKLSAGSILVPNDEYTSKMVDMKTACVYVDYDFEEELWKSPMDLMERIDELAMSVRGMADQSKIALNAMKKEMGIIS